VSAICNQKFDFKSKLHEKKFNYQKKIHACRNTRLADKTIIFPEHEVFKVVVMVTR
jgi:hypothetical protein